MLKKILFLGLILMGILLIVSCAPREESLAGEASKIGGQSNTQKINIEIKNVQKIVQDNPKIRNMVLKLGTLDPKLITRVAEDIERCSATPSCSSSNYEVTATDCGFPLQPGESCYICSVSGDLRARAECPEGWGEDVAVFPDGVDWGYGNGFTCWSMCARHCYPPPPDELTGLEDFVPTPDPECLSRCQPFTELENPCPDGFTYHAEVYGDLPADISNPFRYFCSTEPTFTSRENICNQCGGPDLAMGPGSNGDIFCLTYRS